jgi:hypothetical protein
MEQWKKRLLTEAKRFLRISCLSKYHDQFKAKKLIAISDLYDLRKGLTGQQVFGTITAIACKS